MKIKDPDGTVAVGLAGFVNYANKHFDDMVAVALAPKRQPGFVANAGASANVQITTP